MIEKKCLDNGFAYIDIRNDYAHVKIALQGAHIFHYKPHHTNEVLWLSKESFFRESVAIRGGIPICWPWFGKHETDNSAPQHGFARTAIWELIHRDENDPKKTLLTFELTPNSDTLKIWPHRFKLSLHITIGKELSLSLCTYNDDDHSFKITEALHSYFHVNDICHTSVSGLEESSYVDQLKHNSIHTSALPLTIDQEIDRVYTTIKDQCSLQDRDRKITIKTEGSSSTVVWNPWINKEKGMKDFHCDGYKKMLCIETANALDNSITLEAGQTHTVTQTIIS